MKATHGFTLLEVMIVIALVSLMASIAIPNMAAFQERVRTSEVRKTFAQVMVGESLVHANGMTLMDALIMAQGSAYCTFCEQGISGGMDPKNASNLEAGKVPWRVLGFDQMPIDPWGRPYLLDENETEGSANDNRYDSVFSAGPDGIFCGTNDGEQVCGDDFILRLPTFNVFSPSYVDSYPYAKVGL